MRVEVLIYLCVALLFIADSCQAVVFQLLQSETREVCFFEELEEWDRFIVEYQVLEAKTRKVVTVKVVDPMGDIMYSDSDISHEDYDIISLYADFDGKYQVCFGGGDKDTSVYLAVEGGDYLLKTEGAAKKTVDSMLADVVEMKRQTSGIKTSARYLRRRLNRQNKTRKNIDMVATYLPLAKNAILFLMALVQIITYRRWFEKKLAVGKKTFSSKVYM